VYFTSKSTRGAHDYCTGYIIAQTDQTKNQRRRSKASTRKLGGNNRCPLRLYML
jgi:hypothetical protein